MFVAYHSRSVTLRRRSIEASAIEGTVDDSEGTARGQTESGTASSRGEVESSPRGRAGNTTQHGAVGGLQGSVPEHCGIFPPIQGNSPRWITSSKKGEIKVLQSFFSFGSVTNQRSRDKLTIHAPISTSCQVVISPAGGTETRRKGRASTNNCFFWQEKNLVQKTGVD